MDIKFNILDKLKKIYILERKMNYSEYVHTYSESFISKYNDFIVNHYIKIEYDGDTIVSIKIINI